MKWDGEWHITIEVFRDMGLAFAAVLVLIYVLVVGWFRSFIVPLVIMAPIPLTLVGILPAHAMLGAFFTATSMIGFIAGAGIIVRNSIILVDFIECRQRQGMPLAEAVIDAGAVRFRPMLLTAAAVVVGASVIFPDPIFQGLALSLIAGAVASTFLSRLAVPVLYYMVHSRHQAESNAETQSQRSKEFRYDSRTRCAPDGRRNGPVIPCTCAFRFALLALADGIRRTQPVAVGIHKLVPGHAHPARHGLERCSRVCQPRRRSWPCTARNRVRSSKSSQIEATQGRGYRQMYRLEERVPAPTWTLQCFAARMAGRDTNRDATSEMAEEGVPDLPADD